MTRGLQKIFVLYLAEWLQKKWIRLIKSPEYQNLFSYDSKSFEIYLKFIKNYCLLIAELK